MPVTPASEEKQAAIYKGSLADWFLISGGGGTYPGQMPVFIGTLFFELRVHWSFKMQGNHTSSLQIIFIKAVESHGTKNFREN